eukprot:scaffold109927_cov30-Tisochrysis_lutea.AAC.3
MEDGGGDAAYTYLPWTSREGRPDWAIGGGSLVATQLVAVLEAMDRKECLSPVDNTALKWTMEVLLRRVQALQASTAP